MSKEAMKLALEEMKIANYNSAAERLKAALAKQEQRSDSEQLGEPVAWEAVTKLKAPMGTPKLIFTDKTRADEWLSDFVDGHAWLKPLSYTTPQQRKPLTHEQRFDLLTQFEPHKNKWEAPAILIDMAEAAHGIKE